MRLGFFGGSFDPPHSGHLAVARAARDAFRLQRVLLAPTGRQPLKPGGSGASFVDRLEMTALLCAGEPGCLASAIDGPRPDGSPNFTADTLQKLRESEPPDTRLFAVLGADAFLGLPQWRSVDRLFALADWIVVSRPGFRIEHLEALRLQPVQRARVHLLDAVHDTTSATEVRAKLLAGDSVDGLIPAPVRRYIAQHGLYRAQNVEAKTRP